MEVPNPRKYGTAPFSVAAVHGGPGAAGEMAEVAGRLGLKRGVLEPLQTALSVDGQVEELRAILEGNGDLPVSLIGYSWGGWLCVLLSARYPRMVGKLILVSSGPFEEAYAAQVWETRMSRMNESERSEFTRAVEILGDPEAGDREAALERLGALAAGADSYDPLPEESEEPNGVAANPDVFARVWPEAAELRRSGELLRRAKGIDCPVVAIHGAYDPHPPEGVKEPLSRVVKTFRFHLLEKCGHQPWRERWGRTPFFSLLERELNG